MVYAETLFNYPFWNIPFRLHTDECDKQLGGIIIQNNKPIAFLSRRLSKLKYNYTKTKK